MLLSMIYMSSGPGIIYRLLYTVASKELVPIGFLASFVIAAVSSLAACPFEHVIAVMGSPW